MATKRRKQRTRKTRPKNLLAADRRRRAISLRAEGKTFVEIGKALGVTGPRAFQLVLESMDEANALLIGETKKLRQRQLDRIEALVKSLWKPATKQGQVAKVDRIVRLLEREARLAGLDAPTKSEFSGPEGGPISMRTPQIWIPPEDKEDSHGGGSSPPPAAGG